VTLSKKALTEPLNFIHTRNVVKYVTIKPLFNATNLYMCVNTRCIFGEELGTNIFFSHQVILSLIALKYKSAQDILKHGGVFPSLFSHHLSCETKLTNLVKYALHDETLQESLTNS
jgi:hypothetical protein